MPKILSYIKEVSLLPRRFVVIQQQSWQLFCQSNSRIGQSTLHKYQCFEKQSEHGLNIHSGYDNIQKSFQKQSKALEIWSSRLLYPNFTGHFCSFLKQKSRL